MEPGPSCGHESHVDGCGPCEAGLARLRHMVDAHGFHSVECPTCEGEGVVGHDCGEDCCPCLDPEDNVPCGTCGGEGSVYSYDRECADEVCLLGAGEA